MASYALGVGAQDELRYAAGILAHCVGDSSGSRLYWALVDKGLVESASFSHDSADGAGVFIGYLSTGPEELENAFRNLPQRASRGTESGVERRGVAQSAAQTCHRLNVARRDPISDG